MRNLTLERYIDVRRSLVALGHGGEYDWAQTVGPPKTAEDFACEYAWVVINSGMRNSVAEKIWARVRPVLERDGKVGNAFGHVGKRAAIDRVWLDRAFFHRRFLGLDGDVGAILAFCDALPWIGGITKYHLAKNLGVDCAKPDRWLVRLAEAEGETVDDLCARLAAASGDRIATVDVVLWRACAVGVLTP